MSFQKPIIIAHRGAKGMAPENTLVAFKLGLEQGCDGIELDVHLSADNHIIVCHDETLNRTTNGKGYIREKTLEEIKCLDAGSWYSETFKGEPVPTLGEVFDLVPKSIMINVEIKYTYEGEMVQHLLEFMRERDLFDQVVVSSFNHKCLVSLKRLEPRAKIGLLYSSNMIRPTAYAKSLGVEVYSLHPQHQQIDEEDVQEAAAEGLRVYPFTVNAEKDMKAQIEKGSSGIITDYPARLKSLLYTVQ